MLGTVLLVESVSLQSNTKTSTKQFDEAFDNLVAFLFEEYRKRKELIEIEKVKAEDKTLIKV